MIVELLAVACLSPAPHQDPPPPPPPSGDPASVPSPGDPCAVADEVSARLESWRAAEAAWEERVRAARGDERRALRDADPALEFAASFEELASAGDGRARLWLARHVDRLDLGLSERRARAVELWERVVGSHAECAWLADALPDLAGSHRALGADRVRRLLRAVAGGPGDADLRARAGWELARLVERTDGDDAALGLYADLVAEFPGTEAAAAAEERRYVLANLRVGRTAPDFEAQDVDGAPIRLSDHRGEVVVIDFWGLWCKPCVAELPHLAALWERHRDGPFVVLGIDTDEDPDRFRRRAPELGVTWPNVFQGGLAGPVTEAYRVRSFPTIFVLDDEGVIRHVGLRGAALERAVDALVEELAAARAAGVAR